MHRKLVELARGVKLPMFVRHYLTWPHPAGGRRQARRILAVVNPEQTPLLR